MKKTLVNSLILCALLASGCSTSFKTPFKNIILIIGDGMGLASIEATNTYNDEQLVFTSKDIFPYQAFINTDSLTSNMFVLDTTDVLHPENNTTLYNSNPSPYLAKNIYTPKQDLEFFDPYTDSAAAGTAIACGEKTVNGYIGVDQNVLDFETIIDLAKKLHKKTGVISNDYIDGATPAAFTGHAQSRFNADILIRSQMESNCDVLVGKKSNTWIEGYDTYNSLFQDSGYDVANSKEELIAKLDKKVDKVVSPLETFTFEDQKEVMTKTIDFLSSCYNGYFLMVEGSDIDKCGHANNTQGLIDEVNNLNELVKISFQQKDTLVIVVADHETGAVYLPDDTTKENVVDNIKFLSHSHSRTRVGLYASYDLHEYLKYSPKDKLVDVSTTKVNYGERDYFDNTNVFDLMKYYL